MTKAEHIFVFTLVACLIGAMHALPATAFAFTIPF